MTCPVCGLPSPAAARFCPACGTSLARRADERRLVTVLFADLVGYTALAETRDPETVKNLVDACFEELVADVVAFGGVVDKIVGDAILALFGAPVAHEDDPERAVRAALRMQGTLAKQSELAGVDLRMRVGVNTGEVLVGTLRSGGDYTAMGDVVNTASRLQTLAAPGQVLVGPGTHAAAGGIRFESLGLLQAKGRDAPVPAWAAVEVLGPPGTRTRSLTAPLVGRDAELGLLRHVLHTTTSRRRAAAILLVGEAGLGKTRLADELVGVARTEGCIVLEGRCVPYGEVNVWAPLAEALRRASGVRADDPPEMLEGKAHSAVAAVLGLPESDPEVGRLLQALSPLMGKGGEPAAPAGPGRPAAARADSAVTDEALRAMQTMVERLAARRPMLLVIGELHWADDLLLAFLDRLVERLSDQPVLLVATTRPELLRRWQPLSMRAEAGDRASRSNLMLLHVDPLDDAAAADLLTHLAGEGLSEPARDALVARSGGNPLWLEELAALSAQKPEHAPRAGDPERSLGPLPATLRGLVAARLDLLHGEERSVLEDASVCGRAGSVAALEAMAAAAGRPGADGPLEELCAAGLLTRVHGSDSWELRSELVREVAYGTLTKAERARRHARLAVWLAERAGVDPRDDTLDDLAHHWSTAASLVSELGSVEGLPADTVGRALEWVERAARRAVARELWLPAAGLLDTVLRLAPEANAATQASAAPGAHAALEANAALGATAALEADAGPGTTGKAHHRAEILLERARARVGMRDGDGASADLEEVADAATLAGDDHLLARSLVVRGDLARTAGRLTESAQILRRGLDIARRIGDDPTVVAALRALGQTLLFAGDEDGAESTAEEALAGARRLGDGSLEAWAMQTLAWIAFTRGEFDVATSRLVQSAETFAEIGDSGGRGWALGLLAWVRFSQGDLVGAETLGRSVLAEASMVGDAWAQGMIEALIANTRLWSGFASDAVEHGERALELIRPLADPWPVVQALLVTGRARLAAGDRAGGLALLDEAVEAGGALDDPNMAKFPRAALAVALALQLGDGASALTVAPEIGDTRDATGELVVAMAVSYLQTGRLDDAIGLVAPMIGEVLRPSVACWVALVLAAGGRVDDAGSVVEAAEDEPATFLDRAWMDVSRAALAVAPADRARYLDAAVATVGATDDVLSKGNIEQAAWWLSGNADADSPQEGWARMWASVARPTVNVT